MERLITTCPNGCNSNLHPSGIIVPGGELNECDLCGQLVSSCSKEHYEKSNQSWDREEGTWPSKKDYPRLLKRRKRDIHHIASILSKNYSDIRILDVGCSNGSSVYIANNLGLQAEGIDTSENAISDGIKRGLKLHVGLLKDVAFDSHSFDAITLYEVIEHLHDPFDLFSECERILRPNGVLLIGTGNADSFTRRIRKGKWHFLNDHAGHVNLFSPKSLSILASRTGFSVVKVVTYSIEIFEKHEVNPVLYRTAKLFGELFNIPAKLLNKGHQMEVYLKVNKPT